MMSFLAFLEHLLLTVVHSGSSIGSSWSSICRSDFTLSTLPNAKKVIFDGSLTLTRGRVQPTYALRVVVGCNIKCERL